MKNMVNIMGGVFVNTGFLQRKTWHLHPASKIYSARKKGNAGGF